MRCASRIARSAPAGCRNTATTVSAPADVRAVLSVNGALVLILGIVPGGLMALCADAIVKTLAT